MMLRCHVHSKRNKKEKKRDKQKHEWNRRKRLEKKPKEFPSIGGHLYGIGYHQGKQPREFRTEYLGFREKNRTEEHQAGSSDTHP